MFGIGQKAQKENIFLRTGCLSVGVNLAAQSASVYFYRQVEFWGLIIGGPTAGNANITVWFDDGDDSYIPANQVYLVENINTNAQTAVALATFRFPCVTNACVPMMFPKPILSRRLSAGSTQTSTQFFVNFLYR